jgi:hypothetical protein
MDQEETLIFLADKKRSKSQVITTVVFINSIFLLGGWLMNELNIPVILVINLFMAGILFFSKSLEAVSLNNNSGIIKMEFLRYFKVRTEKEYLKKDIEFAYRMEYISRTVKGKRLTFFERGKRIIRIDGANDGWSDEKMDEMVQRLIENGITRLILNNSDEVKL